MPCRCFTPADRLKLGWEAWDRTRDHCVNSAALYRLSYFPMDGCGGWTRTSDLPGYGPAALPLRYAASVWWTASVSNRPGMACRAFLRPGAQPVCLWSGTRESSPAHQLGGLSPEPVGRPALFGAVFPAAIGFASLALALCLFRDFAFSGQGRPTETHALLSFRPDSHVSGPGLIPAPVYFGRGALPFPVLSRPVIQALLRLPCAAVCVSFNAAADMKILRAPIHRSGRADSRCAGPVAGATGIKFTSRNASRLACDFQLRAILLVSGGFVYRGGKDSLHRAVAEGRGIEPPRPSLTGYGLASRPVATPATFHGGW